VPEHGQCLNAATGAPRELEACRTGAEEAREELAMSDLVIEHDLIREFRKDTSE
jgi:hypothetical protein